MNRWLGRLFGRGGELAYGKAKELARHEDPKVRQRLADRTDLKPEIMYYLAEDPVPEVRRAVAANHTTPAQADMVLARDADVEVRSGLAQKIARLAPGLTADEQDRLRHMTYETLQLLARDQITRVRQMLAETMRDMAGVPPEVIRRLAGDAELVVAGPILEFSPVLTDEDLLAIIADNPVRGALSAISRRSSVAAGVADAIAATDDAEAIAFLLGNPSAQIREETLDRLVERAIDIEEWHAPLVRRPKLSAKALARLACFVADNLVQALQDRKDLDPAMAAAVSAAVRRRLADAGPREGDIEQAMRVAHQLHQSNALDEARIVDAMVSNDLPLATAALAVMSGVELATVSKIIDTRSPKGMLSVAWKAGLSVAVAAQLQGKLARVPPPEVIKGNRSGHYPMTTEEMDWQIEFFSAMAGKR